tara:strand:- start:361 stop:690 length:330 start_codon:yes stop_codon:yes gene_type:complete
MLKLKYCYKDSNRTVESIITLKHRNYEKTIEKARKYNEDINNDIFIAEITNLNIKPKHTTCLDYYVEPSRPYIKLKAKNNILGNNPFDCIYAIPYEDDEEDYNYLLSQF